MSEQKTTKTHNGRLVLGLIFVCGGVALLCNNFNIVLFGIWKDAIVSIPMVGILWGLWCVFKKSYCSGLIVLGTGLFFIIPKIPYEIVANDFIQKWSPVWLIYVGVVLILFRKTVVVHNTEKEGCADNLHQASPTTSSDGKIDHACFLNGAKLQYTEAVFKGGDLRATFGGIELDLSKTTLQSGENYLNVSSFFGGVTILVPNTWNVDVRVDGVLGGFEDKRKNVVYVNNGSKLIIHVSSFLGGGELKTVENSI